MGYIAKFSELKKGGGGGGRIAIEVWLVLNQLCTALHPFLSPGPGIRSAFHICFVIMKQNPGIKQFLNCERIHIISVQS